MVRKVETRTGAFEVLEAGEGPAVLLLHGWPESARAWRHQLTALADAGYRAIAYNQRGYGGSYAPEEVAGYNLFQLAGDAVAMLDALGVEQAVVVGHDWGAPVAYHCALLRADRFRAVAGLSVPYAPRGDRHLLDLLGAGGLTNFYIQYFQAPGVAEAELDADVATTLRRVYHGASGDLPPDQAWRPLTGPTGRLLEAADEPAVWPRAWLPAEEFDRLVDAFTRSGFRGGLNWYRNIALNWRIGLPLHGAPILQPSLFIAGARDGVIRMPGHEPTPERLARALPNLRGVHLIDDVGHWVQQEAPEAVNAALLGFLRGLDA